MENKTQESTTKTADSITVTEPNQEQKEKPKITQEDEKIINLFKNKEMIRK